MIAAVVHCKLCPTKRSRNLATLATSITRAAEHHPAPDLIALPDCSPGILAATHPSLLSRAMCQCFAETLALLAREWGVWIAAGHARFIDGRITSGATLFDPDGDPYVRYPPPLMDGEARAAPAENKWAIRATPLGIVALRPGSVPADRSAIRTPDGRAPDLLIVPNGPDEGPCEIKQLVDLARSAGSYVCLANSVVGAQGTQGDPPEDSVIIDRTGNILAQTRADASAPAFAELDIPAPATLPQLEAEGIDNLE